MVHTAPDRAPNRFGRCHRANCPYPNPVHSVLTEHGVETMGQLDHLPSDIMRESAEWTNGMGPARVTLIEDHLQDWMDDRDWHEPKHNTEAERGETEEEGPEEDG